MTQRGWALLAVVACGPKTAPAGLIPPDAPITAAENGSAQLLGHARPADVLGGFVPEGARPDAATLVRGPCSEQFTTVDADPVPIDGVYGATPEASAQVKAAGASGVWVSGKGSRRELAAIADPHQLARCCEDHPESCTSRFVAEVRSGDGVVYYPDPAASGAWLRAAPVSGAFAFTTGGNPYVGEACGAWREHPPLAAHGTYLLGVSTATFTEANARADALNNGRTRALVWLREHGRGDSGLTAMTEERWCVESFPAADGAGDQFLAQVLLYVPE